MAFSAEAEKIFCINRRIYWGSPLISLRRRTGLKKRGLIGLDRCQKMVYILGNDE